MGEWADILKAAGVSGCLMLFIWGLTKEWWVMGSEFRAMRDDRDFYRDRAWSGTELAETATRGVEQTTQQYAPPAARPQSQLRPGR